VLAHESRHRASWLIFDVRQSMSDLRNDAARWALLLDIGAVQPEEIVRWADRLIVAEAKPSQELIELSTSAEGKVGDAVRVLAHGADVWRPLEEALPAILDFVSARADRAPLVARAFYHVAVSQNYEVPDSFRFILGAEDDFDLADSGISSFDDVYRQFLDDLKEAVAAHEKTA